MCLSTALPSQELRQLRDELAEMMSEQLVLDDFEYVMPDDDFTSFWSTLAWPRKIGETEERVAIIAEEKRAEFATSMLSEQDLFQKSIEKLERVVNNFSKHTDLAKTKDVHAEVRRLQDELRDAEGKRSLFNKREGIFGKDQTDYSQLSKVSVRAAPTAVGTCARRVCRAHRRVCSTWQIVKAFEPYANLWTTAFKWSQWQTEWMTGPFNQLDPEKMEQELDQAGH